MSKKQQSRKSRASVETISKVTVVTQNVPDTPAQDVDQDVTTNVESEPRRWRGIYVVVPSLLALVTSINTLWNHFASDDLDQVLNNSFIRSLHNLPAAFTGSVWSFNGADIVYTVDPYFRPIFSSLFTISYSLFGNRPFGWHLVNILIHVAVTYLVFLIVKEITRRNWVSGVAAALFAVHPVHAESVAWVSGVTDPLMTLFLLPSFFFYLRYRKSGSIYTLVTGLILFFLALLSKETAIALPVVIGYCEVFFFKENEALKQRLVRSLKVVALFVIPVFAYTAVRYQALGTLVFSSEPRYPAIPLLLTTPLAILKYVGLILMPWGYSFEHYMEFIETPLHVLFLLPLAILVAIIISIRFIRSTTVTLGAVWFFAFLAPAIAALRQLEPAILLQERYLYAPSIGICLIIAIGIESLATRFSTKGRIAAIAVTVLLVLVWGASFIRQNRTWDDTVSVYKNAIAVSPRSPVAHVLLSRSYYDAGRPREAEAEARTALDLDARCPTAYLTLSYFARMSGKLEKACEILEDGISVVPEGTMTRHDLATMYINLGLLYNTRKMFDRAEENLLKSNQISSRPVAWYHTGQFYFDQGRFEEALAKYEQTLAAVPRWFAPIHLRLGLTYEALKDTGRAEAEFEKYLELAPPDAPDREGTRRHLSEMKGIRPGK